MVCVCVLWHKCPGHPATHRPASQNMGLSTLPTPSPTPFALVYGAPGFSWHQTTVPTTTTLDRFTDWPTLGTSQKWNHVVLVFLWPAYFTWHNILKEQVAARRNNSFCLGPNVYTTFCLASHLSMNACTVSTFGLLWMMPLWTWVCK